MPSVSEGPNCLLCGQPTRLLYPANIPNGAGLDPAEIACTSPYLALHDDIYNCRSCGLARSVPSLGDASLEELYRDVEDPEYLVSEDERRADFRKVLARVEKLHRHETPGVLLEIGSSVGLFLDEAKAKGWDVVGIEPSSWAAELATSRGLDVFNGTLEGFDAGQRKFDVVASWDVWEHLEDPLEALRVAHSLLKPGGVLTFTTVNMGGLGAKLFGSRWPWFMRMHLHYFTKRSLATMAERSGFEVVAVTTLGKTLKLGYMLDRASSMLGPFSSVARGVTRRLGFQNVPVTVNLGDIVLVEARKL